MPASRYPRSPLPLDIVTNDDRAKPTDITRDLSPLRPRRTPVLVNAPDVRWHLAPPLRAFTSLDSITSAATSSSSAASTRAQVSSTPPSRLSEQAQQSWHCQHLTSFADLHNALSSDNQGPLIHHRSAHPHSDPAFRTIPSPSPSLPPSPGLSPPPLPASSPSPSDHSDPETDPVLFVCPPALRTIPLEGFSPHLLSPVTEASEPGPSLRSR
ncbi:hypothetical protein E8E13_005495 [Curvularia kusanoi]|uniref:Uncharacterized protein n=1 Tax=Curvularia kusanoi TaxID=90978 RepID=A0A9P4TFF3_CURKU|nr:hypothetical protein E8E13_005495 [Curvularia kusanoi]